LGIGSPPFQSASVACRRSERSWSVQRTSDVSVRLGTSHREQSCIVTHARTHARAHAHTNTHTHTRTHAHRNTHTHTDTHTQTHTQTHTRAHTRARASETLNDLPGCAHRFRTCLENTHSVRSSGQGRPVRSDVEVDSNVVSLCLVGEKGCVVPARPLAHAVHPHDKVVGLEPRVVRVALGVGRRWQVTL
jgi:hypothetical protein